MFYHIFTYRMRCILRDRETIFWSAAFPLIMATLFGLALGNISASENFARIPVAIIEDGAYRADMPFQMAIGAASEGEESLLAPTLVPEEEALKLLSDGAVRGVLRVDAGAITLLVKSSGIRETILQSFADTYVQMRDAYLTALREDPPALASLLKGAVHERVAIEDMSPGAAYPDNVAVYYFALVAMACMYGSFQGLTAVSVAQANQSPVAARNNMAPVGKLRVFAASMSAALAAQFASVLVLIAYLRWVIGMSFGDRLGYVVLASAAGTLMGVTLGAMISALLKKREGVKVAVLISVSMVCSFLAGMMFGDMKYLVQKHAPILSFLNPANLVADAFYALYYYDTLSRYALNMGLLLVFSAAFFLVVHLVMRRQRYASL